MFKMKGFKRSIKSSRDAFIILSVLTFFFSAQVALTIYVDSSFLKDTIVKTPSLSQTNIWSDPEHMVGAVYTFASLLTILGLLYSTRILRKIGNYRWTLTLFILHALLLLGLSIFENGWFILPMFMIESALISILYFNFDIFLERYSSDKDTGVIRGAFITIGSIAWLLPPMIAGHIVEKSGYSPLYFSGAILIIPIIILLMRYLSDFQDMEYDDAPLLPTKKIVQENPNIWYGLASSLSLQFFYAWMIIYMPILLHDHIGFSWNDIGLMLTCALTAFVIFPSPAGWLADKWIGEKELLVIGFLIMGLSSLVIPIFAVATTSFTAWALLLFVGRTGASLVDSMNEVYFFKQIDGHNAGLIGYYRRMRPLALIGAPMLASMLLEFEWFGIADLFTILGFMMFAAIYFPVKLKDTK